MTWLTVELGDVADVVMGQSPPGDTYNERGEGLPFFQGKADFGERFPDVRKWCSAPRKLAELGDILLSVRAPVGPTNIAQEKSCIGRGLAAIRGNPDQLDQNYLRLYLRHREPTLAFKGQGSTFTAIGRADIEKLSVPLPSLSEQRRIVEILDQADEIRRLRRKAAERVQRVPAALYVEMFGDPATNPKAWSQKMIGDVCQVISGGTPKTERDEYWGGSVVWVTPRDLSGLDDWVLDRTERTLTEEGLANCSATMLPAESVLLSSRAPIGLVAINSVPVCTNQGFKNLVCGPEIDPWYLFAWCRLRTRFLQSLGHGATFKEVSKRVVEAVQIPLPPIGAQSAFRARMEALHALRQQACTARTQVSTLFDQLLARAFSGSLVPRPMKEALRSDEVQRPHPQRVDSKLRGPRDLWALAASAHTGTEARLRQLSEQISLDARRSLEVAVEPLRHSFGSGMSRALKEALTGTTIPLEAALGAGASRALEDLAMQVTGRLKAAHHGLAEESLDSELRKQARAADAVRSHASWTREIGTIVPSLSQIETRAWLTLERSSRMTEMAAQIGSRMDPARLFARSEVSLRQATSSLASFDSLTSAFEELTSVTESLQSLTALPSFVLPAASRELVAASYALASLTPEEEETEHDEADCLAEVREETGVVGQLLAETEPALAKMYSGAKQALAARGVDRTRQALVSLRELWTHLLRILAPDNLLDSWLSDQPPSLVHDGKPTRRARLLYICREFHHQPLDDFVQSDSAAFLRYLKVFNRIHQLEPDLSEEQLRALILRTESWLLFLLQVGRESREC